jgi:hypothetical protein
MTLVKPMIIFGSIALCFGTISWKQEEFTLREVRVILLHDVIEIPMRMNLASDVAE